MRYYNLRRSVQPRVAGLDDVLGSVETGKLADLVLLEGGLSDGISAVRSVEMVMRGGRTFGIEY